MRNNDDDDDDFKFDFDLKEILRLSKLFNLSKDIVINLVRSKNGVLLLAFAIGSMMMLKERNDHLRIKPEFKNEPWIKDLFKEDPRLTEHVFCTTRGSPENNGLLSLCYDNRLVIDVIPSSLFGIPIPEDLGKIPLSNLLVLSSALGMSGASDLIKP